MFDKNKQKAVNRMLVRSSWKLFKKIFIKVVAVRHSKWKVFQKQKFNLTSTNYLLLRCSTERQTQLNVKTTHPISLKFFSNFLSFDSRVFIFFVFCISSNNRSIHRKCSVEKVVFRNFAKHLCQSLFFNKVADLRLYLKKDTGTGVFLLILRNF